MLVKFNLVTPTDPIHDNFTLVLDINITSITSLVQNDASLTIHTRDGDWPLLNRRKRGVNLNVGNERCVNMLIEVLKFIIFSSGYLLNTFVLLVTSSG